MSDINRTWGNRHIFLAMFAKSGLNQEEEWVKNRLSVLTNRQRNKWTLKKIRKYLLDSFCHPEYVEKKIHEIEAERWQEGLRAGATPRY